MFLSQRVHVLSLLQNKFGLVFFRLFDGALETSNFRFEEARSAITLLRCFLHENTQRGKIARVKFVKELGTMSKNRLRWITPVRGPIWGIHPLTLMISWFKRYAWLLVQNRRKLKTNPLSCNRELLTPHGTGTFQSISSQSSTRRADENGPGDIDINLGYRRRGNVSSSLRLYKTDTRKYNRSMFRIQPEDWTTHGLTHSMK